MFGLTFMKLNIRSEGFVSNDAFTIEWLQIGINITIEGDQPKRGFIKFPTFRPYMFIRRRNSISPLARILLALFLFTFIVSQAILISGVSFSPSGFVISKSKATSPNSQSPYEKTEKDEKHMEDKSVYFVLLVESVLFTLTETQKYSFYTDPNSWGNSAQTPLYLFIRKLLIWSALLVLIACSLSFTACGVTNQSFLKEMLSAQLRLHTGFF